MDFLKELFTEPLSFEAFSKAVAEKGFKLADLSSGKYVDKDKLDTINIMKYIICYLSQNFNKKLRCFQLQKNKTQYLVRFLRFYQVILHRNQN